MVLDAINSVIEPLFNIAESNINVAAPTGILLLGLITGLRHSIEADHVAAVLSVVASNQKNIRRASLLGAIWGLGHTASLFVAGLAVLLLAVNISETVSNRLEFGVGIMLLFLGVTTFTGWSLGKFLKGLRHQKTPPSSSPSHTHIHSHQGNVVHSHGHVHEGEHGHGHTSLIIGMIHGLAGSGALLLIVLSTINSIPLGLAYIAIFGAGSIGGMAGISTLMGIPFVKFSNSAKISMALRYVAAVTTLAIGSALIYDLVWIEQIFTS
ncbi:MAG: urease accessory protein UreH [Thermoproteota archaeon]|nr:urease accessory protein UreH [Thermoproteota archaeon]MDQ4101606.1 urease accessory protein UreH [Thermoproteota archaeon]